MLRRSEHQQGLPAFVVLEHGFQAHAYLEVLRLRVNADDVRGHDHVLVKLHQRRNVWHIAGEPGVRGDMCDREREQFGGT